MSDIIREALMVDSYGSPPRHTKVGQAALAALDRRDAQDLLDQEHLTRVVAERAAVEAERNEARRLCDVWRGEANAAEERSRQLTEALSDLVAVGAVAARGLRSVAELKRTGGYIVDANCDSLAVDMEAALNRAALASLSRDSAEREESDE